MFPARRPWRSIGLLVALVILSAAMGATAAAQVATLGSPAPDASMTPEASPVPDGQQALLDWAACMREQGVDMDDPVFGLDGELLGGLGKDGSGSQIDTKDPSYALAAEACDALLAAFKAPPDPQQLAEQAEGLLAWAACMREQGVDLPDPNPDGSFADYDWKVDLKGSDYTAADEACRNLAGDAGK